MPLHFYSIKNFGDFFITLWAFHVHSPEDQLGPSAPAAVHGALPSPRMLQKVEPFRENLLS